jgi:hypothetical protein
VVAGSDANARLALGLAGGGTSYLAAPWIAGKVAVLNFDKTPGWLLDALNAFNDSGDKPVKRI